VVDAGEIRWIDWRGRERARANLATARTTIVPTLTGRKEVRVEGEAGEIRFEESINRYTVLIELLQSPKANQPLNA
jgi:hypothetical protein